VLTGRQVLRITAVALCGALLVHAAWNALRDEPQPARTPASRASASARFSEARVPAPLDDSEEPSAGVTPADAGTISPTPSGRSAAPDTPLALSWLSGADPSDPTDAGLPLTTPAPPRQLEPPDLPTTSTLPAEQPLLDAPPAAGPAPAAAEPPPTEQALDPGASDEPSLPVQRHLVQVVVTRWERPGMCPIGAAATARRNALLLEFRRIYWDNGASLFVDPRLSNSIQQRLIAQLEAAEGTVREQLQLMPPRPNVFAYADTRLLLAASCANDGVVAYYDGAIHLVPSRADVAESAVHEYTHHALISSGLVGPAWAQEGIAMTVADQTWWRQREWLERVAEKPFSIESMEHAVPYALKSEQASLFYVQAAAMVACALQDEQGGLSGLVRSLRQSRGGVLDYTLSGLADPRSFRACANELLR
jgi:hypothetical protein